MCNLLTQHSVLSHSESRFHYVRYFGTAEGSKFVEAGSVDNVKRTWVDYGVPRDWTDSAQGQVRTEVNRNLDDHYPLCLILGGGVSLPGNRSEEHLDADGRNICQLI